MECWAAQTDKIHHSVKIQEVMTSKIPAGVWILGSMVGRSVAAVLRVANWLWGGR